MTTAAKIITCEEVEARWPAAFALAGGCCLSCHARHQDDLCEYELVRGRGHLAVCCDVGAALEAAGIVVI